MTQKNTPVAIIGAMEQEITLLQSRIAQPQHEKIAHVAITRGTLAGKPVLLAQSGIGKVNAAITTAILLEKYQAACVINTGSAGGLQGGMKQGDVVVGIQTAHHDADATAFDYVIGQLPQMPARYDSDATLVEHAARAAVAFAHFPYAFAVEMEAAAIAQTCYQFARPCVIIRALSDLADGEAEYSFETFLQMAATHSAEMVENLVKAL